jgi:hypothetical protein
MAVFWILLIVVVFWLLPDSKQKVINDKDDIVFTAKFTRGGNLIYPEKLIFDRYNVTLKSNDGANSLYTTTRTQTIPLKRITGYKISRYLVGCNITIIGEGYQNILAIGYTGVDADKIEKILKYICKN